MLSVATAAAAAAAKSLQSCPTLCDPIDGSPQGSRPWDSPGTEAHRVFSFLIFCRGQQPQAKVCITPLREQDCGEWLYLSWARTVSLFSWCVDKAADSFTHMRSC